MPRRSPPENGERAHDAERAADLVGLCAEADLVFARVRYWELGIRAYGEREPADFEGRVGL